MNCLKKTSIFLLYLGCFYFTSCSTNEDPAPRLPSTELYNLYQTEQALQHQNPKIKNTFERIRGSIGKRGGGSKVIWNRKNVNGIGLYVSANHVYNISGWSSRSPQWFNPTDNVLGIFETSQIPLSNGTLLPGNILSADFPLIHLTISSEIRNSEILPEQDFYLGIIDNQKVQAKTLPQHPEKPDLTKPLEMYDPFQRTKAEKTWAIPVSGEEVLGFGFPQDVETFPKGAVAFGKVFSDSESIQIIQQLKNKGDSEGNIPYDSEVEFLMDAQGIPGMSGGGVFNQNGQLLGIMVRASDTNNAPKIIRVVKTAYIRTEVLQYISQLPVQERTELLRYLGEEFE